MANEILKGCTKYMVEGIISPSVYSVSECQRGKGYQKEVERFERLLAKNVDKFAETRQITTGETVAVRDKQGFHRGLVTDVFKRHSKATYWVLLVDYGNVIETQQRNIYFIKNEDLQKKKLGAFEVSLHGIQPAVVKLEADNNFLGGILQKRVSGNWSPKAFEFVRDIFKKDPYIFVRPVSHSNTIISGVVYFLEEPDAPVSLGEKLCSKGFAVSCDASSKSASQDSLQGGSDSGIEEKIQDRTLSRDIQCSEVFRSKLPENERSKISKFKNSSDASIFALQHELETKSIPSSASLVSRSESVGAPPSGSSGSNSWNYSSSWILKKCQNQMFTPAPLSDSYKKGDMYESEQRKNESPESFNGSTFRVVQRRMELFNKKKQIETFYSK